MAEHEEKKKDTYTITKVTLWQGISAILAIVVVVMFFSNGGFGTEGNKQVPTPTQNPSPSPSPSPNPEPTRLSDVSADDDAVKGDPDAPITIIEFSDFQCPFCGRWNEQTLPQLQKDYIDTGKVKLVYRDFPLSFHPFAEPAAIAAECAREQGDDATFYKFHDAIFANQASLSDDMLKKAAKDLGLDEKKFADCTSSGKYREEVQADFAAGSQYGVSGTPSFFINGVKLVGAQPYAAFKTIIDQELAAQ